MGFIVFPAFPSFPYVSLRWVAVRSNVRVASAACRSFQEAIAVGNLERYFKVSGWKYPVIWHGCGYEPWIVVYIYLYL